MKQFKKLSVICLLLSLTAMAFAAFFRIDFMFFPLGVANVIITCVFWWKHLEAKTNKQLLLPCVSLAVCLAPILLWLAFMFFIIIPFAEYAWGGLLVASRFGSLFYIAGGVLGIIYIVSHVICVVLKKTKICIKGLILSFVTIVLSGILLSIFTTIYEYWSNNQP